MEERRMRVEDDPDGKLYETFLQTAFEKSPYRWPTIGSWKDIKSLTRTDLEKFWKTYYQPSNVVLALVGKLDPQKMIPILEKTFGKIEGNAVSETHYAEEPPQEKPRRVAISFKAQPRFMVGYHKPTLPADEDYVFDIIQQILLDGRTSRLYKWLVLETQIASSVHGGGGTPGSRLAHLFTIDVDLRDGKTTDQAMKIIRAELAKLAKDGVSEKELEKTKNSLSMGFVNRLRSNEGLAEDLSHFQVIAGSWKYLATYLDKISKFNSDDVKRVAAQYLIQNNETIAEIK
ncbi:MAG: insulinase family protein [Deltaproteobacteria bacterium]|nr:MAG: insulinase family protein [Deltaproteobacteria bacterium]